jgi:AcrR family transcriptional regulator
MGAVSAAERREQARAVALELLAERRFENLSLRDVARELGVPLSTLTYTYSAVTDLLDDFEGYVDEPSLAHVGSGGLQAELLRYRDEAFVVLTAHPGLREVWRYRMSRVGRGTFAPGVERMEAMIATIRENSGESYRLPDRELGHMFRYMTVGALIHWLDAGPHGSDDWYESMLLSIKMLVVVADPQPS